MRLIDAEAFMDAWNLNKATKYGNKDADQQRFSYGTMMMYEIADAIEDAPTVEAVPLSVIEDIKAEIECRRNEIKEVDEKSKTISMKGYVLGLDRALEIIDRKVNEVEHDKAD